MKINRRQLRRLIETLLIEQVDIPGIDEPFVQELRMKLVTNDKQGKALDDAEKMLLPFNENPAALNKIDEIYRYMRREDGYNNDAEAGIAKIIRKQVDTVFGDFESKMSDDDIISVLTDKVYPGLLSLFITNK